MNPCAIAEISLVVFLDKGTFTRLIIFVCKFQAWFEPKSV
jgi:hypothetical protein